MKVRTDFVTNSSSSSFVTVEIDNPVFAKICEQFREVLEDEDGCFQMMLDGSCVEIHFEEGYASVPTSLAELVDCLIEVLMGWDEYYDEEYEDEEPEEGTPHHVAYLMKRKEQEIIDATASVTFSAGDVGWQGDSDSRYYKENYSADELAYYLGEIAAKNACTVEEVTEEMWDEYVGDKTSIQDETFTYNRETGEVSHTKSMTLE